MHINKRHSPKNYVPKKEQNVKKSHSTETVDGKKQKTWDVSKILPRWDGETTFPSTGEFSPEPSAIRYATVATRIELPWVVVWWPNSAVPPWLKARHTQHRRSRQLPVKQKTGWKKQWVFLKTGNGWCFFSRC